MSKYNMTYTKYLIYKILNKFLHQIYYTIRSLYNYTRIVVVEYEAEVRKKQTELENNRFIDSITLRKDITNIIAINLALEYIKRVKDFYSFKEHLIIRKHELLGMIDGIIIRGNNQEVLFSNNGDIYHRFIEAYNKPDSVSNDKFLEFSKALTTFRQITMDRLCEADLDYDFLEILYGKD